MCRCRTMVMLCFVMLLFALGAWGQTGQDEPSQIRPESFRQAEAFPVLAEEESSGFAENETLSTAETRTRIMKTICCDF